MNCDTTMKHTNKSHYWTRLAMILVLLTAGTMTSGFDLMHVEDPDVSEGNSLYDKGKYDEAIASYDKAYDRLKKREDSADARHIVNFDRGNAYYRKGDWSKAGEELLKSVGSKEAPLRAKAYYNLGNVALKQISAGGKMSYDDALEKADSAIDFYKRSLRLDTADRDAKYNLEVAYKIKEQIKKQKEEAEKQQQENKDQQKQDQEKQDQQKQDQQKQDQQKQDQQKQDQEKKDQQKQDQQKQDQEKQDQQKQDQQKQDQEKKDQQKQDQQNMQQQQQEKKNEKKDEKGKQGAEAKPMKPLDQQQAEDLLDSLRESEKPLKLFLFESQDENKNQNSQDYKEW